ncbi:unnamed protein product [Rotaria sp. Silwood1]|nr:unnamed protein product [Rotaria sp. Silwood1]CAF1628374.1 unnamed protein product [Rotaria sp. Silwood1]
MASSFHNDQTEPEEKLGQVAQDAVQTNLQSGQPTEPSSTNTSEDNSFNEIYLGCPANISDTTSNDHHLSLQARMALSAVSGALSQVKKRVVSAGDDINDTTSSNSDNLLAESSSCPVSESVSPTSVPQRKLQI